MAIAHLNSGESVDVRPLGDSIRVPGINLRIPFKSFFLPRLNTDRRRPRRTVFQRNGDGHVFLFS